MANLEENNQGLVREAIYIKDKSYFSLNNSVVSGFKNCILLEGKIANISANLAKINLQTVLINNCDGGIQSEIPTNDPEIKNWYSNESFSIEYSKTSHSTLFKESNPKKTFDFRLKVDPIVVSGN